MALSDLDKKHLSAAYAAAWNAVKGKFLSITVDVEPHGWFSIKYPYSQEPTKRVRASELIKGLAVLAGRLERGEIRK